MFGKKKETLDQPDALTFYYMDTLMCNEYLLQNQECMQRYTKKSYLSWGRSKLHKECLNYLD